MKRVLELNVDDLFNGGVFKLVRDVIINNDKGIHYDIGAVEPFSKQENIDFFKQYGTDVYFIGYEGNKFMKQLKVFQNLWQFIKTHDYDYVHIHSDVAYKLFPMGLAMKLAGCRHIILHSHSSNIDGNDHRVIRLIAHNTYRRFLKYIGTTFVSCSDLASDWMFPNVPKSDIVTVRNGVDLEKFKFNESVRKDIRQELGLEDELLIGHVGRFAYQKNHDYLIDVMAKVKQSGLKAKLLLVGEGPLFEEIVTKVKESVLQDDVIFYGTSDKVEQLFSAMDIFVLPSHFEGLPLVGVEAQASGLPVIYSENVTREAQILPNVVFCPTHSDSTVEWVEAILSLTQQSSDRFGAYQILKDEQFDIKDVVKAFSDLYV